MGMGRGDVYCKNCGVLLRGGWRGFWWHARAIGPVACAKAEPEEDSHAADVNPPPKDPSPPPS